MENTVPSLENHDKSQKWFFFVIGILLGFVFGISTYFMDKYIFNEKIHFSSTIDKLYRPLQKNHTYSDAPLQSAENVVVEDSGIMEQLVETDSLTEEDSLSIENSADIESEEIEDDVEFMLPEEKVQIKKEEVEIVTDVLLIEQRMSVQYISEGQDSVKAAKDFFMVQQWSSPIRNRHTYQLKNKTLKLKGVDISRVSIVNYEGDYYLLYNESISFFLSKTNFSSSTPVVLPTFLLFSSYSSYSLSSTRYNV